MMSRMSNILEAVGLAMLVIAAYGILGEWWSLALAGLVSVAYGVALDRCQ